MKPHRRADENKQFFPQAAVRFETRDCSQQLPGDRQHGVRGRTAEQSGSSRVVQAGTLQQFLSKSRRKRYALPLSFVGETDELLKGLRHAPRLPLRLRLWACELGRR